MSVFPVPGGPKRSRPRHHKQTRWREGRQLHDLVYRVVELMEGEGIKRSSGPLTCWMPSFSTRAGGKILEANALRKMALNSESSPPIPMSSNLKFGWRMAFGGGLSEASR
jgi:hypothetical protein